MRRTLGTEHDWGRGRDVRFAVPDSADLLHRPRVIDCLTQAVDHHRVTMLSAPSGYGKTVAIAEWSRGCGAVVAWLSCNRYDSDPATLSNGILTSLRRTAWGMNRDDVLAELDVVTGADTASVHAAIVAAMRVVATRHVLVIDDLHLAGRSIGTSVLGGLVEQGPANLRLILVGRDPAQLPLAGRELSGEVARIGSTELRFTRNEIEAVADEVGWTAVDTESVAAQSGGWAAAVRLALLVTSPGQTASGFGDGHSPDRARTDDLLLSIIAEDVLGSLPPDLAAFVLDATTVSDVDGALAAGLSDRDDALALLEECRRRGLFLERFGGEESTQFRWHEVFAGRCRQIVALRDTGHSRELHRRAAELVSTRMPLRAIDEALVGGDPGLAYRILIDSWLLLLAGRTEESPDQVLTRLPEPYATRPEVVAVAACAIDMAGRRTEAQALLASADQEGRAGLGGATALRGSPRPLDDEDGWRAELTTVCAQMLVYDDRPELIDAVRLGHTYVARARTLGPARYAAFQLLLGRTHLVLRYDVPEGIAVLTSALRHAAEAGEATLARRAAGLLAFSHAWVGEFEESRAVLARMQNADGGHDDWSTQIGTPEVAARGWIAFWTGDFDESRAAFTKCLQSRADPAGFGSIAAQYLATIAAIDGTARERHDAVALVRRIPAREVRGVPWHLYRRVAFAILADADGDRDRAAALAREIRDDLTAAPAAALVAIELIRRHVGKQAAAALVRQLAPLPLANYMRASLLVTSALINRSSGDYEAAHEVLERALGVAAPAGIARPFLESDPALADLLAEHGRWGTNHAGFIADLCASTYATDDLTDRERQILGYLRTTMTLAEIAGDLDLSVNTVKTHTRSLYRKLGVQNRRNAVAATVRRR